MKLQIDKIFRIRFPHLIIVFLSVFCSINCTAQIVSSNPLEYVALAEGNELINGQIMIFYAFRYILSIYLNVRRFLDAGTSKRMGK